MASGLMPSPTITSFFLMGCSPSWYLSGRIEFTLLISRNLMFLIGLLKLYSFPYRFPFRESFTVFEFISCVLGVEEGRLGFMLSNY